MIKELSVTNFRCFRELHVPDLRRVNVIVGKNSSGKSALLEALFLCSAPAAPNLVFQLRGLRNLGTQIQIAGDAAGYRALWEDLFHWFNENTTISIEAIGSEGDSRSWRASYSDVGGQLLPIGKQAVNPSILPQIVFEWKRNNEAPVLTRPVITPNGLFVEGISTVGHFPTILFSGKSQDSPEEHARRFSELSKRDEIAPVVKAMRVEFPFLESLSLEYFSNTPAVYASLTAGGLPRKIPAGLVSEGFNKLLGILVGIATYRRGLVLIDQIEDGFYYRRYESIWRTLHTFAMANACQIFATTHSLECLRAMISVLRDNTDDFCLLRAERTQDESSSRISRFEGEQLLSALLKDGEIR